MYHHGENLGLAEQIMLAATPTHGSRRPHALHGALRAGAGERTVHFYDPRRDPSALQAILSCVYRAVLHVGRASARATVRRGSLPRTAERSADLVHFFDADPSRIVVIPLAPRARFFLPAMPHRAERPYLINVGNHRQHKDVATLLAAWSSLPPQYEVDLFLTGADDFHGELQRLSTSRRRVAVLGDIDDDTLASYYAGAQALVHPSLLEGFGLPFVEAMAQGCPVIATTTSIPEPVAGSALSLRTTRRRRRARANHADARRPGFAPGPR